MQRSDPIIPVYQEMNEKSEFEGDLPFSNDEAIRNFDMMVQISAMDSVSYDVQRQGRISFYITNQGEEATQIGSVSAMNFEDEIWTQYRELGCFLYRGLSIQDAMDQQFSTKFEPGKGRQMPVHYTLANGHVQSVTSPLGTKILHAAGAGYAFKLDKADRLGVVYFGEGAASEGDFAVGLNFAATRGAQTLFICRNNGYAISTRINDQYKGDGIAPRALAYGMKAIRVDGNDIIAVHKATKAAREYIMTNKAPVLLELMTYRRGHHSTSDDSSRYRADEELKKFSAPGVEPISRFGKLLEQRGIISSDREKQVREAKRQETLDALRKSEKKLRAPIDDIFTDVYAEMPWHLQKQLADLKAHIARNRDKYDLSIYENEGR